VLATVATLVAGYVVLAAVMVGLGAFLVHVVVPDGGGWDERMNRWLADHRVAWLNHLTAAGTFVANTVPVIVITLVVSVGFLIARRWREPLLLVSALVVEFLVFLTANALIDRDRPDVVRLDSTPSTASYPSGHIAATIVVWGGLAIVVFACTRQRALRVVAGGVAILLASLVGFARVYRGMHHLTDVVAGAMLGIGALVVAVIVVRVTGVVAERRKHDARQELDAGVVSR
jgi:membrane-associated phospholipid phosphatase